MTANNPQPTGRPATRANSLSALERLFDIFMMILFAALGVLLGVFGIIIGSVQSVVGAAVVVLAVVPLWAGGRPRPDGGRRLGWYPAAAALLIAGLVMFVHPWTK